MSKLKKKMKKVNQYLTDLPRQMYDEFVDNTPVKTGNARKNTHLRKTAIEADYGYAVRLEGARGKFGTRKGWSSQAPNGMLEPTVKEIKQRLRRL